MRAREIKPENLSSDPMGWGVSGSSESYGNMHLFLLLFVETLERVSLS